MQDESKKDRIWLVLCTVTGVVVDVTLNKFSSMLPSYVVVSLWAVPALLFVIWIWRVEATASWVKRRFLEHPVSYVLMFLILIPFGLQATAKMVSKLKPHSRNLPSITTMPSTSSIPSVQHSESSRPAMATLEPPQTQAANQNPKSAKVKPAYPKLREPVPETKTPIHASLSQSIGSVDCANAGNCAGVNNGQQIFNQYGPPQLVITDAQRDGITTAMSPFAGLDVSFYLERPTTTTEAFAQKLCTALRNAGLNAHSMSSQDDCSPPFWSGMMVAGEPSDGITVRATRANLQAANALGIIFIQEHVLRDKIKFIPMTEMDDTHILIQIKPYE